MNDPYVDAFYQNHKDTRTKTSIRRHKMVFNMCSLEVKLHRHDCKAIFFDIQCSDHETRQSSGDLFAVTLMDNPLPPWIGKYGCGSNPYDSYTGSGSSRN